MPARWVVSFLLAMYGLAAAEQPCTLDRSTGTTIDAQPLIRNGYCTRWNYKTNRLVYMAPGTSGYYRIFTASPDGTGKRDISEGCARLPNKHQGAPYWHPSGRYILLIAEKQNSPARKLFGVPDYESLPGFGKHSDLWLMSVDGAQAWQLTNDPESKGEDVLIPVFSPDGTHVAWASSQANFKYAIHVAEFVEKPAPHLEHIRKYQPGGEAYYEPGAFTSDGRSLTYASDQDTHSFWRSQIYELDLGNGRSLRLTQGNDYNEHPTIVKTPTGDWVVYMSTKGTERFRGHWMLGTDWYAIRLDGSGRKRLTTMNVRPASSPESTGQMQVGGTVAMSPGGEFLLGDIQDSLVKQTGYVRVIRLTCK